MLIVVIIFLVSTSHWSFTINNQLIQNQKKKKGLLGSISHLFPIGTPLSSNQWFRICTTIILGHLLFSNVKQYVQSIGILLDEFKVRFFNDLFDYISHILITNIFGTIAYYLVVYCKRECRFRQGFRNVFCCTCFRSKQLENTKSTRHHVAARYSCASEATGPSDMRVRFNGNGNITLQATSATDIAGATGSSSTSPLQSRTTLSREML